MPSLSNLYLLAYNSAQAIAWAVCLALSLGSVLSTKTLNGAYASAGDLIYLCQMVAFLEVVHGAVGLVPSGVVIPLMQWAGRTNCMFVMRQTHEVQELPAVLIIFVAWSISEIIRYPTYALNCIRSCPPWLTYLRYSAFLVLYPPGMGGETWIMYYALPFMKKYSFGYYRFLMVVLFCYPFLCLKVYLHMVKQRRSKLGKQDKKKKR
ncbi:PREDICTED: very-long-chain (3R)-3-hydroxyacyl-CoA dehydratase 2 [Fragaria vesca subsp. vesca]|uniref:very-long-chain (3R)-3-hydroxyacyl-CoA dehydratase 2 n=1 Tax=Fragaria vesca subsp. vesca TaxID=101020 RepID=UPI0002C3644E|nr:PREDICTED: very-long-chain (3R)-3-hydroxyacyl-CoA dehydratase 2 [Fragaria vesca subsp. vesca]XP_011461279.1 PREDICTED: very-long-chain (3R)-3-hydroxyacyl-CoA dehydratase 2 [Fragaria vesca subsp. vesca]XP_011461280.1 PREDICTED: very-long-chain (3R)-3-hydroxyacyl-CoA dehydratase 2 [Fragaria vesca subsp. vesca]